MKLKCVVAYMYENSWDKFNKQEYSSSVHTYNISMVAILNDFVNSGRNIQFSECGLVIATCKHNYVFSQKTFSS